MRAILATGYDYSWFVLTQTIIEKEFALSGSEQNPDITEKDLRVLLRERLSKGAPSPVEKFKEHGEDFVVADTVAELVAGMNKLARGGAPDLDPTDVEAMIVARDRELDNDFSKDAQLMLVANARRSRTDKIVRVAKPHKILDPAHGPLIAVRLNILTRKTLGGIQTDLDLARPRRRRRPVPGLYAAGEVAGFGGGGVHGYNALEGTFLGGCIFSGRAAGRSIADCWLRPHHVARGATKRADTRRGASAAGLDATAPTSDRDRSSGSVASRWSRGSSHLSRRRGDNPVALDTGPRGWRIPTSIPPPCSPPTTPSCRRGRGPVPRRRAARAAGVGRSRAGRGFMTYRDLGGATGDDSGPGPTTASTTRTTRRSSARVEDPRPRPRAGAARPAGRARFEPDEPESVMVGPRRGPVVRAPPTGVTIHQVTEPEDVRAMCVMADIAFGHSSPGMANALLTGSGRGTHDMELWVAEADGAIVSCGRLEPVADSEFAGLWGGATLAGWRSRGIYRALTSERRGRPCAAARPGQQRPTEYSRPILERAGWSR